MELLIALGAALTVAVGVLAVLNGSGDSRARRRIEQLREHRHGLPTVEPSLMHRSSADRAGDALLGGLPGPLGRRLERLVARADAPMSAGRFLLVAGIVTSAAVAALIWIAMHPDGMRSWMQAALAVGAVLAPWLWLRRRGGRRTARINQALPQALDLIVTNIECGQGLQGALMTVAEKVDGPIGAEIGRAMREIGVGVPRETALAAMGARSGSDELAGAARAIAQAERSGVSIAEILRARASEIRERRRLLAREQANKVPVKMTIPTVLFIFPTFFLLVLGPVALNAADVMVR